jgi:hypothetical protein
LGDGELILHALVGGKEFLGHGDHCAKHAPNFLISFEQLIMFLSGKIFAITREVQPDLSFGGFAIRIG